MNNYVPISFVSRIKLLLTKRACIPRLAANCIYCVRLGWDDEMISDDTLDEVRRIHQGCYQQRQIHQGPIVKKERI